MDDDDLVARMRNGDLDAAGMLFERHDGVAFRAALRLLGNRSDAEDIAQESLVRAYTRISDLEQGVNFAAWLRRIAVNLSLNVLRRRGVLRIESLQNEATADDVAQATAAEWDTEELVLKRTQRDEIDRLLLRLPAEQRVAIVLRDMYGYDGRETAALAGCGISALKMRLTRGRALLRRLLVEAGVYELEDDRDAECSRAG